MITFSFQLNIKLLPKFTHFRILKISGKVVMCEWKSKTRINTHTKPLVTHNKPPNKNGGESVAVAVCLRVTCCAALRSAPCCCGSADGGWSPGGGGGAVEGGRMILGAASNGTSEHPLTSVTCQTRTGRELGLSISKNRGTTQYRKRTFKVSKYWLTTF